MNDVKKQINETMADLKQQADDLRVKMHLARMDASDEWKDLEAKLVKLEAKAKELSGVTAESAKDIGAAAKLLGEEIRDGFKRIARRL